MTETSLSRLLKPHKIKPKKIRVGAITLRGYEFDAFRDTFDRYLSQYPLSKWNNGTIQHWRGFRDFHDGTSG